MDLVRKSAARASQAGSFDMMLGSTNALMSQLKDNKVIGQEDLSAFQQQLDGVNALPQEQKEMALLGLLRNISGVPEEEYTLNLDDVRMRGSKVIASNPRGASPITLVGNPYAKLDREGKPGLYQRRSNGTEVYVGKPVPSAATGSRSDEVSPTALLNATMGLRTQFSRETNAAKIVDTQLANMESSLKAVQGDADAAGSQGVLTTFQKILDPLSVVRESEYARGPSGLSLLASIQGMYDKYTEGGAGVPVVELEKFVALARQFAKNQRDSTAQTVESINSIVEEYGINPVSVFGKREAMTPSPSNTKPNPNRG